MGERSAQERRRYVENRARRTSAGANTGRRWSITDARTALDPTLSVPDAAVAVGRSAVAVERLRAKWRSGRLPAGLINQVPPPPAPAKFQEGGR
jgi:hypothetical protein